MRLADQAWREVPSGALVLVPVGSTEQHGPHLPLNTDTAVAEAVAARAADDLGAVVAPAIAYGSSGEHQDFAGTISIGTDVLHSVLLEVARSLGTWARQVVFVNGHGGNVNALDRAVAQLADEGHRVAWVPCIVPGADLHAGRTETSLMLHLSPSRVLLERAQPGSTAPLAEILPTMVSGGVSAVSANGVLGDPAGATAAEGRDLLAAMAARVVTAVQALRPEPVR